MKIKKFQNSGKIAASNVTAYLPKPNTPKGNLIANKLADRIENGEITLNEVPQKYKNYVKGIVAPGGSRDVSRAIVRNGVPIAAPIVFGAAAGPIGEVLSSVSSVSPAITHGFKVLVNPASANTTAGAMTATVADAYGAISGGQSLYNTGKKIWNGTFNVNDVPEAVLGGLTFLPGANTLTKAGNWRTAFNTARNISNNAKNSYLGYSLSRVLNPEDFTHRGWLPKDSSTYGGLFPAIPKLKHYKGSKVVSQINITPQNASSITPDQWDFAYFNATLSGNVQEAQRLRDLHFISNPTKIVDTRGFPRKVYHGSPDDWYVFDDSKRGVDDVIYFSTDKKYADQFTIPRSEWTEGMNPKKSARAFYLHGENPINVGSDMYYDSVQDELRRAWLKGINADSVYGLDAETPPLRKSNGIELGVLRRTQPKLANYATYDDSGNLIPLSKRDDFTNPDIRYAIPLISTSALNSKQDE